MKKLFFVLSLGFFAAALFFQFRYDFVSNEFRLQKTSQLRLGNLLVNMPPGGYTRQEIMQNSEERIQQLSAEIRGEKIVTREDVQFEEWIAAQKEKDGPLVMFLYGAALLFLFGGMMKPSALSNTSQNTASIHTIDSKK